MKWKKMLRKKFLSFSILVISLAVFGKAENPKTGYQLMSYIQKIKDKELMHNLRMISYKGTPNRFFGTSGHKKTQDLIENTLKSFNEDGKVSFRTQSFKPNLEVSKAFFQNDFDKKIKRQFKEGSEEYKKWNAFNLYMQNLTKSKKEIEGKNFIWSKKGKSNKKLILIAHYDTVSHQKKDLKIDESQRMPGADYNASGVAILLSLVKLITPLDLENSIEIAFIDAQSLGYLGAYEYAQDLKKDKDNIVGVLNLEMLGHDSKVLDKDKKLKNFKVYMRSTKDDPDHLDERLYKTVTLLSQKLGGIIRFEVEANNFKKSDHFRFWEVGIPSIVFTQNWDTDFNPRYQTADDFPETINQKTFNFAYRYIALSTIGYLLDIKR